MIPAGFADEAALRAYGRKLQELHIRLLFCRRTRDAWHASRDGVLREAGLPPEAADRFPDIDGDRFRAEAHGRRAVVERAIDNTFPETRAWLKKVAAERGPGAAPSLDDFLCSAHFFEPRHALPHPTGIGPGYENHSKYFFWLREVARLDRPGADTGLRTRAYAEFAAYLLIEYKRPHIPYYDRFKGGLHWRETPGVALPVLLMAEDHRMFKLGNPETVAGLSRIGLIDLDTLCPPELPDEPTLS